MVAAIILTLVVVAFRVVLGLLGSAHLDWLHNFSPLAAVALCGAIFFPRRIAIALPMGALLVSDLILNAHYGAPFFSLYIIPHYLALLLIAGAGWLLRDNPRTAYVLLASTAGSVFFFVITNTGSWLANPLYAKTAEGWSQALTTGLPGYPTTLHFFRHTFISDFAFTALFLLCLAFRPAAQQSTIATREPAGW